MTNAGLDFRNPEGSCTLACFKKVCIIERNINEIYRETSTTVPSGSNISSKKVQASNHLLSEKNKKVPVQEVCSTTMGRNQALHPDQVGFLPPSGSSHVHNYV